MGLGLAACVGSPSEPARSTTATESSGTDRRASLTIDEVLAMPHRSEANRARDRYRHPSETLAFLGIPTADSPNEYRRTSGLAFRAQIAERGGRA
ncbi:MAG: hypothetical protein J0L92_24885 [Deltaproteobacteria bacterium]|nr:hypothetical protein [Deltaproteobacteria bacterium]